MLYYAHGALAQLGARHTGSVEATGSSPVCSTEYSGEHPNGVLAQLGARNIRIVEATGSIPVYSMSVRHNFFDREVMPYYMSLAVILQAVRTHSTVKHH